MKKVRRVLGIMMCMVLAFGCLTGCGGKKSDEEILTGAVTKINEAKSTDINMKMSGKMTMDMGELGGTQDIDMSTELTGTQFSDPVKMKATTNVTSAGTSTTVECYMQEVDGDFVVYTKADDEWTKTTLTDYKTAMQSAGISMVDNFSSDIGKYTKKEDKTEGDKTYLVYDYTISGEEIKDLMGGVTSSMDSLLGSAESEEDKAEMEEMLNNMINSIGSITLTLWIDKEEETIYRIDYPMTDLMNNMMNSLMDTLKNQAAGDDDADAADLAEVFSQIKITVSDMNAIITYSNVNAAADFEIPKEALEADEMSNAADLDTDEEE